MPLELIAGAVVGAAVASPNVRKVVRRGMIYGLAGVLIAYDKVASLASGAVQGARKTVAEAAAADAAATANPTQTPTETSTPEPVASRSTAAVPTS